MKQTAEWFGWPSAQREEQQRERERNRVLQEEQRRQEEFRRKQERVLIAQEEQRRAEYQREKERLRAIQEQLQREAQQRREQEQQRREQEQQRAAREERNVAMDVDEIRRKFDELTTNVTQLATQLNANKVHRPPSQPLPRLTGEDNDLRWDELICQMYDMGNANGWTKEHYCQYMPQCLAGEAKDVYRLLSKATQENWEDLTRELGNGIRQLLSKERAQQLLANCKQKEGEAPSTFMLRVKKLAERGYPIHKPAAGAPPAPPPAGYWTEEQHNATVISHFRHGLLPKLHAEVIRRQAEATPHGELQKVIEGDRIQQIILERQQEHNGSSMTLAAINAINAKVDNLASEQQQLRRNAMSQPYQNGDRQPERFDNRGFQSTFNQRNEPYQQGKKKLGATEEHHHFHERQYQICSVT